MLISVTSRRIFRLRLDEKASERRTALSQRACGEHPGNQTHADTRLQASLNYRSYCRMGETGAPREEVLRVADEDEQQAGAHPSR